MPTLQRGAAWAEERHLGALRQSAPPERPHPVHNTVCGSFEREGGQKLAKLLVLKGDVGKIPVQGPHRSFECAVSPPQKIKSDSKVIKK